MSFAEKLAQGKVGESAIARWFISRGHSVLPVYEIEIDRGKGPQFYTSERPLVAPDMFIMPLMYWVEAKHKTVCTWYRNGKPQPYWCTGIDLHHYQEYLKVQETSKRPIWLLFLHRQSTPDPKDSVHPGCPQRCPVGLYGHDLSFLAQHESHRSDRHGRHGMVYWDIETLKRLASLADFEKEVGTNGPDSPPGI